MIHANEKLSLNRRRFLQIGSAGVAAALTVRAMPVAALSASSEPALLPVVEHLVGSHAWPFEKSIPLTMLASRNTRLATPPDLPLANVPVETDFAQLAFYGLLKGASAAIPENLAFLSVSLDFAPFHNGKHMLWSYSNYGVINLANPAWLRVPFDSRIGLSFQISWGFHPGAQAESAITADCSARTAKAGFSTLNAGYYIIHLPGSPGMSLLFGVGPYVEPNSDPKEMA